MEFKPSEERTTHFAAELTRPQKPGMKIGRKQRPPTPRWLHGFLGFQPSIIHFPGCWKKSLLGNCNKSTLQTPASALGILGSYGLFQDNFPPLFRQAAGINLPFSWRSKAAQTSPEPSCLAARTPNWTLLVHTTNYFNDMPLFLSLTLPSVDTLRRLLSTGMGVGDDEYCFGITLPETNSKIKLNIGFQSSIFRVELLVSGVFLFNSLNILFSLI